MKRLFIPMALAALFACRPNGVVHGLYPTGTAIGGFVSDATDDSPITGAAVILSTAGKPDLSATTDSAGIFQVTEDVQADSVYTVKVTAATYAGNQVTVQTSLGRVAQADVVLSPMEAVLAVTPTTVDLGVESQTSILTVSNAATQSGPLDWVAASPADWVTISPTSGRIEGAGQPVVLTLTANRAALGTDYGPHSAFVAVSSNGGIQYVAVRIDYPDPSAPQLDYDLQALDFALDKTALPLAIRNTGTGTLQWTAPTDIPWISCTPTSGSVAAGMSGTVSVKIDRTALLAASDYDVFIAFASNTVIDLALPVRVHASTPHVVAWETTPQSIDLGKRSFGSEIILHNTGTDSLDWTASATTSWLQVVPSSGHIGAGAFAHVQVQLDRSIVPLGPFSQSVHVHSAASDVTVPVTGNRQYVAVLEASSTIAVRSRGEKTLTAQMFVNNSGEPMSSMDWRITTATPWLTFSPASSVAAGHNLPGTETFCGSVDEGCGQIIDAHFDLTGISTIGSSTATATVTSTVTGESQEVFFSVDVAPFHWPGTTFTVPTELQTYVPGSMVYDSINDRLLVLHLDPDTYAPSTWAWKNGAWTQLTTAHTPAAAGLFVFDRRRGVAVLMPYRYQNGALWEFDGADWVQPSVSSVHPSSAVFDPVTGKVLALEADGTAYNVLAYDGVWHELNHAGVPGSTALGTGTNNAFLLAGPNDAWVTLLNVQNPPYLTAIGALARDSMGDWKPASRPLYGTNQDTLVVDQKNKDLYLLGQSYVANPTLVRIDALTNTRTPYTLPVNVSPRYQSVAAYDYAQDQIVFVGGYCGNGGEICSDAQVALALHAPGAPARSVALTVPSAPITFASGVNATTVTVTNSSPYVVPFSALPPAGYTASPEWADVPPQGSVTMTLTVNRAALGAGAHVSTWNVRSLGHATAITLSTTNP